LSEVRLTPTQSFLTCVDDEVLVVGGDATRRQIAEGLARGALEGLEVLALPSAASANVLQIDRHLVVRSTCAESLALLRARFGDQRAYVVRAWRCARVSWRLCARPGCVVLAEAGVSGRARVACGRRAHRVVLQEKLEVEKADGAFTCGSLLVWLY
jgi:hypothetical protein